VIPDLVEELGDVGGEALGGEAELDDRPGLDQAGQGKLPGQVIGVVEGVDEVDLVPDDEGRRGDGVALLVVGVMGPASIPWSTAVVSSGSSDRVPTTLSTGPIVVRGTRRASQATIRARGRRSGPRAAWARDEGGPRHGPLEHRHLDQQTPDPFGGLGGHLQRDVGAQRDTTDDGLLDAELVEQGHHVVGVRVDPMGRGVTGLVRPPVSGEVEEDDPIACGHQVGGQPAVHLAVEEDPVHEHEDVGPASIVLVMDMESLDLE